MVVIDKEKSEGEKKDGDLVTPLPKIQNVEILSGAVKLVYDTP
jgi:hypothetical protein